MPTLTVGDATIIEGDHGTRNAVFTVALSRPYKKTGDPTIDDANKVTVGYSTVDVDATGVPTTTDPDGDYVTQSNRTLTFLAGQWVQYVAVTIIGDTNNCGSEANGESFHLVLSGATKAKITRATGTGTILNDDTQCGVQLGIGDASVVEGDTNLRDARVVVSLSDPAPSPFSITVATGHGGDTATGAPKAQAGADYVTTFRTIQVAQGVRAVTIQIPIVADTVGESNEFFSVVMTSTLGHVTRAVGTVTIIDDDPVTAPTFTYYSDPLLAVYGGGIITGPDNAIWFTNWASNQVGRIATSGQVTVYGNVGPAPYGIAIGPDGALWVSNANGAHSLGRITTSGDGSVPVSSGGIGPVKITSGPDGALWFTNQIGPSDRIGRYDPRTPQLTTFDQPGGTSCTDHGIVSGPDGALWFTCEGNGTIGRVTTSGQFTPPPFNAGGSGPWGITAGPDGAVWYTLNVTNAIGRITTNGTVKLFTDPAIKHPGEIVTGPDGALWFTNTLGNSIGRLNPVDGHFTFFTDPGIQQPDSITVGPDHAIWFTNVGDTTVGRLTLP